MPFPSRIALLLLTALAAALRFPAFFANHFHADEALFASWARLIAVWRDPLLLTQAVDKPPLLFYLAALFYPLFGPVEWAVRWPNLAASILLVPLTAVLAWRLYGQTAVALLSAAFVALSPLAIQFSATLFIDPLLTFFVVSALIFAVGAPQPFWSGLCFGLAALTKYQAWLFLPLLLGLGWLANWSRSHWRRWALGLLGPLLVFLGWQLVRTPAESLLSNQWRNFGGLRLAWSWELGPRLRAWLDQGRYIFGPWAGLTALLSLAWPWLPGGAQRQGALADRLFSLFVVGYLLLHWLVAIPAWDRYLIPLLPLLAVLLARGLVTVMALLSGRRAVLGPALGALLLAAGLLPGALAAAEGRFPIGGRPDADHGAWQVAAYLRDAPYETVLYDHWYSWHWREAFFDKGVYVSWFPYPNALVEDLAVFGATSGARYLVAPDSAQARPVLRAVGAAGFQARPVLQTSSDPGMLLYRLEPATR